MTEITQANSSQDCALLCASAALDKKAENLKVLEVSELCSFADYFVIASGHSDRQVQAICDSISQRAREGGYRVISSEGYNEGRWAVIDLGDVVIHIFHDAIREYYGLDELWREAPKMSLPPEIYGPAGLSATRVSP